MIEKKFKKLLNSMNVEKIKSIIKDYNDACVKANNKENKILSSGKKKDELVKDVLNNIPDEEKQTFYDTIEPDFVIELVNDSITLANGTDKREKIALISDLPKVNGIKIDIKGFQWEESTSIEILSNNNIFAKCTCRIGSSDGICRHIMAGYLILLSRDKINETMFPLSLPQKVTNDLKKQIKVVITQTRNKEDADIVLEGEYRIYLDRDQKIAIAEWEGDYAGKKTYNFENYDDLEDWVSQQVADKVIGNIKIKRDDPDKKPVGNVRYVTIDNFGVISKIFARSSLIGKLVKKLGMIGLPTQEEEMYNLLIENLQTNKNPEFSKIVKIAETPKKSKPKKTSE
jgi:hypothetical protein